jgi:hypothetical protein
LNVDTLDRILGSDEEIEPSSGLVDTVMHAVLEEAQTPPPLRFPWHRFVVGTAAAVAALVAGVTLSWIEGWPVSAGSPLTLETLLGSRTLFAYVLPAATLLLTLAIGGLSVRALRNQG